MESLAPSRMEAAALYEELVERELIDPDAKSPEDFLTEGGRAIAGGKTRRSSLSAARRVLDDLLARVERTNEQSLPLDVVQRIWLFGSVMREEETVGDIDLAIETERNPLFGDDAARAARLRELIDEAPSHLPYFRRLFWHQERGIFGVRRHPLLGGAHMGSDELQQLGVPCQLIYDRSRGGRVSDEIAPRHPASSGRSNEMSAPGELPDLTPLSSIPSPMDARWMSAYSGDGRISPHRLFTKRQTVPGPGCYVMTDDTELHFHDWCPSSLGVLGYDGVSKILLKYHDTWSDPKGRNAASMVPQRSIRDLEGEIEFRLELSHFERPRRLKPRSNPALVQLCGMVAMVMAGDLYRQTVRLNERNLQKAIAIDIDPGELPSELRVIVPVWIESLLNELSPSASALEDEAT